MKPFQFILTSILLVCIGSILGLLAANFYQLEFQNFALGSFSVLFLSVSVWQLSSMYKKTGSREDISSHITSDFSHFLKGYARQKYDAVVTSAKVIIMKDGTAWGHIDVFQEFCDLTLDSRHLVHFYTPHSRITNKKFLDFLTRISSRGVQVIYTFTDEKGNDDFWKERFALEKQLERHGEESPLLNVIGLHVGRENNIDAHQAIIYEVDDEGVARPVQTLDTSTQSGTLDSNFYCSRKVNDLEHEHSIKMILSSLKNVEFDGKIRSAKSQAILDWLQNDNIAAFKKFAKEKKAARAVG